VSSFAGQGGAAPDGELRASVGPHGLLEQMRSLELPDGARMRLKSCAEGADAGAGTRFVAGREVPMDRRRLRLGFAGFGIMLAVGTPGLAGDDLCKSPRLGVMPSWCGSKEPEAQQIPEGHVSSRESAMLGTKKESSARPPRAFRPPKSLRLRAEHKGSRR